VRLRILYFASLREALGLDREDIDLPDDVQTAAALRDHLSARGGAWTLAFAPDRTLRVAIDQSLATPDARLHDGAELAFFPPVTGG
jgi:molybdopterin synthase sulfur carrier subunit